MDLSQLPEIEAKRLPARGWLAPQAHMRRRFGIRYLLAVTTASAVLFAALPGGSALLAACQAPGAWPTELTPPQLDPGIGPLDVLQPPVDERAEHRQ